MSVIGKASSGSDKEIFRRTAAHTKAINLGAKIFRGGTRL